MSFKDDGIITIKQIITKFIEQDYTFNGVIFDHNCYNNNNKLDFGKLISDNNILFKNIPIKFYNCSFNVGVEFNDSSINEEKIFKFTENSFKNVRFNNQIDFTFCNFKDTIEDINNCIFQFVSFEKVNFIQCKFDTNNVFSNDVTFNNNIYITNCIFFQDFLLQNININGDLIFESNIFKENFFLNDIYVNGNLKIYTAWRTTYSEFHKLTEISCTVKNDVLIDSVDFYFLNIWGMDGKYRSFKIRRIDIKFIALLRHLTFNNFAIYDCDLQNFSFLFGKISNCLFSSCNFDFKNLIDEKLLIGKIDNEEKEMLIHWYRYSDSLGITDFQINDFVRITKQFERYFDEIKDYYLSGEFHKKSFDLQRKEIENFDYELRNKMASNVNYLLKKDVKKSDLINYEKKSFLEKYKNTINYKYNYYKNTLISKLNRYRKWINLKYLLIRLYGLFSSYGESYTKPLNLYIITILIFGIIYLFTGLDYLNKDNSISIIDYKNFNFRYSFINDYLSSLFFSLNNSFPFKKDLLFIQCNNSITNAFMHFQTLIQTIFITLFLLALRRKFKR